MKPFLLYTLLTISSALAAPQDDNHLVSPGGGIASPASSTSVFENPAGLAFNSSFKATLQSSLQKPNQAAGGILTGSGGTWGGTAGLGHTFSVQSSTYAFFGLAVRAEGMNASLGASGFTDLSSASTTFNAGLLLGPFGGHFEVGMTLIGLDQNVSEWGLGAIYRFEKISGLLMDMAVDTGTGDIGFLPALLIGNADAGLTLGYGFGLSAGSGTRSSSFGHAVSTRQLPDSFTAGAGLKFSDAFAFNLYYNRFARFYAALTMNL